MRALMHVNIYIYTYALNPQPPTIISLHRQDDDHPPGSMNPAPETNVRNTRKIHSLPEKCRGGIHWLCGLQAYLCTLLM